MRIAFLAVNTASAAVSVAALSSSAMPPPLVSASDAPVPAPGRPSAASLPAMSLIDAPPSRIRSSATFVSGAAVSPPWTVYSNAMRLVPVPPEYAAAVSGRSVSSGRAGVPDTTTSSLNATTISIVWPG